ncbi:MAG TPA: hypothetical protein PKA27_11895 [Fimbriimonadaceae bacterium]|nr:hypothetical protein [Fimbriimonadaceae bacterium]
MNPTGLSLQQGDSAQVTMRVTSYGVAGNYTMTLAGGNGLTVSPASHAVTIPSSGYVERVFTVTASESAPLGNQNLVGGVQGYTTTLAVSVVGEATPDFTFTANPGAVTSAIYEYSTPVAFTLTSVGGFSGDVVVDWTANGEVGSDPGSSEVTHSVSPAAPTVFNLRLVRYPGTDQPITMTFTATHVASNTSRTATVTLNLP